MMVDQDVAKEIVDIRLRLGTHDSILAHQTKTLDKVSLVLERVVVVAEKQSSMETQLLRHIETTETIHRDLKEEFLGRYDKLEQKVQSNHTTIIYWSGGISALIFMIGIALTLTK